MKITGVKISDMDSDTSYIAHSVDDCHDKFDTDVFTLVISHKDIITIGHTFGQPIWG